MEKEDKKTEELTPQEIKDVIEDFEKVGESNFGSKGRKWKLR